jgi:hypothetical protein
MHCFLLTTYDDPNDPYERMPKLQAQKMCMVVPKALNVYPTLRARRIHELRHCGKFLGRANCLVVYTDACSFIGEIEEILTVTGHFSLSRYLITGHFSLRYLLRLDYIY